MCARAREQIFEIGFAQHLSDRCVFYHILFTHRLPIRCSTLALVFRRSLRINIGSPKGMHFSHLTFQFVCVYLPERGSGEWSDTEPDSVLPHRLTIRYRVQTECLPNVTYHMYGSESNKFWLKIANIAYTEYSPRRNNENSVRSEFCSSVPTFHRWRSFIVQVSANG